jgi:hypothetical protein
MKPLKLTQMLDTWGLLSSKPLPQELEGRALCQSRSFSGRRSIGSRSSGMQEVTGNVAHTCRYYGISRQTYYSWFRRYEEFGLDGLRDRSKRPKVSPWATSSEVVAKIVYLRSNYHFGPQKIQMYLTRYHDITISVPGFGGSSNGST